MFGEIYNYAARHLDMFNVAGVKVEHDETRERIKIKIPGVIIYLSCSCITVKHRTCLGGYIEIDKFSHTYKWRHSDCTPKQIVDHIWAEAIEYSNRYTPPPKRAASKKELPSALEFSCPVTSIKHVDGRVSLNVTIETAHVISLVAIANNLKLVEANDPDSNPWFFIECRTFSSAKIYIATDGGQYYPVRKRSYRVMEDWNYELSEIDKLVVKEAIKVYTAKIAE